MVVRFPNGQAIVYNGANYILRRQEFSDLYEGNSPSGPQGWIAQVPNFALIEYKAACHVYDAANKEDMSDVRRELEGLRREMRSLARRLSK